jgi:hypothetical protein
MISIRVRGHALAQGIFDAMHGRGVSWREPDTSRGDHTIIVQRIDLETAKAIVADLSITTAKIKEF